MRLTAVFCIFYCLCFIDSARPHIMNEFACSTLGLFCEEGQGSVANTTTLKLVHIVFRHGLSSPSFSYPTDPHANFSNGRLDHLTNEGLKQMNNLGAYIKKRYRGFIGDRYETGQIHMKSSDVDKVIMSASAVLSGLYPTNVKQDKIDPLVHWQPLPVHVISQSIDNLISFHEDKLNCRKYNMKMRQFQASNYVKKFDEAFAPIYAHLTSHSGREISNYIEADKFLQILKTQKSNGLRIPAWAETVYTQLEFVSELVTISQLQDCEMAKLRGGPLLHEMLHHMDSHCRSSLDELDRKERNTKMWLYAGHEETLVTLMTLLGFFQGQRPDFGSMIILEYHSTECGPGSNLKVFFKNGSQDLQEMTIPGCKSGNFKQVVNLLSSYFADNWDEECGISWFSGWWSDFFGNINDLISHCEMCSTVYSVAESVITMEEIVDYMAVFQFLFPIAMNIFEPPTTCRLFPTSNNTQNSTAQSFKTRYCQRCLG